MHQSRTNWYVLIALLTAVTVAVAHSQGRVAVPQAVRAYYEANNFLAAFGADSVGHELISAVPCPNTIGPGEKTRGT